MYCHNCGRKIPDGASSCSYCYASTPSAATPPQSLKRKKLSAPLLVAVCFGIIVLLAAGYFGVRHFSYQNALDAYEKGEYTKALELFTGLGTYKDSQSYIEDCKINQKYEDYDPSGLDFEVDYFGLQAQPVTRDQIEQTMATFIYGTWYREDTDEAFVIDSKALDEQEYRVCAAKLFEENMCILFYYPSAPDQFYRLETYPSGSDSASSSIHVLSIYPVDNPGAASTAYDLSSAERDAIYAEEEARERAYQAELEKQRVYSDSAVVEKATEFVESKLNTTLSASRLFSYVSVDSSLVEYDPYEKTYTCYLEFTYFDAEIFSSTAYQGYFLYKDANSKLTLIEYSIG